MSKSARELPAIRVEPQTSIQAWKQIEKDYTPRLSLVAHEWATEHLRAWNTVFAEGRKRGNAGDFGPALVEMEIADADKRAKWACRTCCEIWEIQGRAKCRAFFRAIFDWCLQPMFATREGRFRSQLEHRLGAGISQDLSAIGGHMKQEMDRLRAKWNTKLEIATRDAEYQRQRMISENLQQPSTMVECVPVQDSPALQRRSEAVAEVMPDSNVELLSMKQVCAVASSFTWRELESRFREIQSKQSASDKVSAERTRTEWDSGLISEECWIRGDSVCRTEYERLASIAARKLGYAGRDEAANYWLRRVLEWLQRAGLDKDKAVAWCPTGSGDSKGESYKTAFLLTDRIAEMSAIFCVELMAHGAPESAVSLPVEQAHSADRETRPGRTKGKTSKTKDQLFKTELIFGAIQAGLKGQKYCATLDSRRVRLPDQWIEEGCPDMYGKAYREPRWRKRIQDEKSRYREQYDKTSVQGLEAIIQGENSTRHTRQ